MDVQSASDPLLADAGAGVAKLVLQTNGCTEVHNVGTWTQWV